ncbi:arginine--tRNA ligase [Patescibacteria group bacterium]|nr:arginine--tRNA ligase [Patescibacteria group bacterium]
MYSLEKIKLNIVKLVNKSLNKKIIQTSDLIYPPNPEFGDLSLPCFELAKKLNKTAVETAEFLVSEINVNDIIVSAKAIGPYLNFTINKNYLAGDLIGDILSMAEEYGANKSGKGKKVMIEYSNVNTHKEYHVGHLRNICYGGAVAKILSANGFKSIPVSYINDFGIHVAKTLWRYAEHYKNNKIAKGKNKGGFLGELYAKASRELKDNPTAKERVSSLMKKIESRQGAEYKLWQKTRKWSIDYFDKIYKELRVEFDNIFYESEFIEKGMKMVRDLCKKEFLIKSQGAIIADLEKYNLGVLLFLRSDNTALYPVADLPLAVEKFKKYKIDKSIYVVDVRQGLYFKQLFKVLELLGFKQEMAHLGYEFVKLPGKMMSSRTGDIITYENLRAQAVKKAARETKKRRKDWSAKKITDTVNKIVNGALKFEMIKVSAGQVITFDINQALRFDGFTAAYLQYVYARIQSIFRKAQKHENTKTRKHEEINLEEAKEHDLVMKLAKYPDAVKKAGENCDPSEIAKYLFDLAQLFNDYYHSVPILKAKKELRASRLALIKSVSHVIANGLGLLGIEVVDEM